jgi:hypothetical protein
VISKVILLIILDSDYKNINIQVPQYVGNLIRSQFVSAQHKDVFHATVNIGLGLEFYYRGTAWAERALYHL